MDVLSRQHIFHGLDGNLVFLNEPGKSTRAKPLCLYLKKPSKPLCSDHFDVGNCYDADVFFHDLKRRVQ